MPQHKNQPIRPLVWLGLAAGALALWNGRYRLRQGKWINRPGKALITGASSGIGASFARQLAARGYHLTLVARRAARLEALAAELRERYKVAVDTLPADLTDEAERGLVERTLSAGQFDLLVNNAGFGLLGPFAQMDPARQAAMVRLHDEVSVSLTRAALPGMITRGRGGIIFTSSITSFLPMFNNAVYSASKTFLNNFAEALAWELDGTGVAVQSLCPGFTVSEFHKDMPDLQSVDLPPFLWMEAEAVVDQSLRALGSGQVIFVPGLVNRLIAFFARLPVTHTIGLWIAKYLLTRR